jgi:hypothetical protein
MSLRLCGAFLRVATLLLICPPGFQFAAMGQAALPTYPGMGAYADLNNQICGKLGAKWNPRELPWIGCFGLSAGNSTTGVIAGRQVDISVGLDGKEICKVDGASVECDRWCFDENGSSCNTTISVISHTSDKSVFLYVSQRVWGYTFVTNQDNWDYYSQPRRCEEPIDGVKPDPSAPNRHYKRCYRPRD